MQKLIIPVSAKVLVALAPSAGDCRLARGLPQSVSCHSGNLLPLSGDLQTVLLELEVQPCDEPAYAHLDSQSKNLKQ